MKTKTTQIEKEIYLLYFKEGICKNEKKSKIFKY